MREPMFKQGDLVLYNDFQGVYYRVISTKTTSDDNHYYELVLVTPAKGAPTRVSSVPEELIRPLIILDEEKD